MDAGGAGEARHRRSRFCRDEIERSLRENNIAGSVAALTEGEGRYSFSPIKQLTPSEWPCSKRASVAPSSRPRKRLSGNEVRGAITESTPETVKGKPPLIGLPLPTCCGTACTWQGDEEPVEL